MDSDSLGQLIFLVVLLCMSAFFSMSETALTSLSKIRLKGMVDEGIRGASLIEKTLANPRKLLSSILIGNNIVKILASAMATSFAISSSSSNSRAVAAATIVITFLILVFGEITPKTMAAQNSEKISLLVIMPINFCMWFLTPIVFLIGLVTGFFIKLLGGNSDKKAPLITEAELKTMVNVSHQEGVLKTDEKTMINNVFDFDDFDAKDVMTPRTDIVAVSHDATYEEIKEMFKKEKFTRMPVYKESTDNIVGILHLKDFAFFDDKQSRFNVDDFSREPYFTYESKPTSELFKTMRTKSIPIAIILDEYGGTSGLVTLEDLIEEIVGDISDEHDDMEKEIIVIKEDEYIIDGSTKIDYVNEMIGTKFESEDFDSIGGYVMGIIGNIPIKDDFVESDECKFIIEEVDKNRILKVRIYT